MTNQARVILVVDDNPADIYLAHEALEQNPRGIRVESAGNVEEALLFLKRRGVHAEKPRPDLVILDLNMPREDGRTVLAEIKSDENLRTIPIVVFSTSHSLLDIRSSYELGANCYVSKPGNLNEYLSAVQSIEQFWFECATLPRKEN